MKSSTQRTKNDYFKNAGNREIFVKSPSEGIGQLAKNQLENNRKGHNNTSRTAYERKVH